MNSSVNANSARFLLGFTLLCLFWALGVLIVNWTGAPIPANVVGMGLLAAGLWMGWVRLEWVAAAADGLLRHLGLLFVPAGAGVMLYGEIIRGELWPIAVTLIAGTALTLAAAAWAARAFTRRGEGDRP